MATPSDLPSHLHEYVKKMPKGLLERLHPGEANHRLQAVHEMTESADRISNPAIHRAIRSHAKRLRDAMPYLEFTAERDKLRGLRDSAKDRDIWVAYGDAIRKLEHDHEQVSGVGEAQMRWEREHPERVSKAAGASGLIVSARS
jgi:uncharacterized caspase-like protein